MPATQTIRPFMTRWGLSRLDLSVAALLAITILGGGLSFYRSGRQRQRTVQAANFLADIHRSQEIYHATHGVFSDQLNRLDLRINSPVDFDIQPIQITPQGWRVSAIRSNASTANRTILSIDQTGWVGRTRPLHRGVGSSVAGSNSRFDGQLENRSNPADASTVPARLIAQQNGQS